MSRDQIIMQIHLELQIHVFTQCGLDNEARYPVLNKIHWQGFSLINMQYEGHLESNAHSSI